MRKVNEVWDEVDVFLCKKRRRKLVISLENPTNGLEDNLGCKFEKTKEVSHDPISEARILIKPNK